MTDLRVVHQFADTSIDPAELIAYADRVRQVPGAGEAEVYASLHDLPRIAMVERWSDETSFAVHWARARDCADDVVMRLHGLAGERAVPSEFYAHQFFRNDRIWLAGDGSDPTAVAPAIVWPAHDGIRIVLQLCVVTSAELRAALLADQHATRLEPGCLQYEWYQCVETPEHVLLLELWDNQVVYDHHWHLRIKTGPQALDMTFAERTRGANGIEFYRHQSFTHLYDRWLPTAQDRWSETVVWPA